MSQNRKQKAGSSDGRRVTICLLLAVVASIVVHGMLRVKGLGEPDSARLAVLAAEWSRAGSFHGYDYPLRTSPLYIHLLKWFMSRGADLAVVVDFMNWLNVVVGSVTMVPLFLLWRRFVSANAAAVACVLYAFTPAYWLANLYGMPHLISFGMFVTSLYVFAVGMQPGRAPSRSLIAISLLMAMMALGLKSDMVLCFGAYLGVLWYTGAFNRTNALIAAGIPVIAIIGVTTHTRLITSEIPALAASAGTWSQQFPFTVQALTGENVQVLATSSGRVLAALCAAAIAFCVIKRAYLRQLALAASWAVPPLLFWGLKMGNSARHMMAPYGAIMLVTGVVLASRFRRARLLWPLVVLALAANYVAGPQEGGTVSPTSYLHRLTPIVQRAADYRRTMGMVFVGIKADSILYAGNSSNPYVAWEVLENATQFNILSGDPLVYRAVFGLRNIKMVRIEMVKGTIEEPVVVGPSHQWMCVAFDEDVQARNYPRFKGKMPPYPKRKE